MQLQLLPLLSRLDSQHGNWVGEITDKSLSFYLFEGEPIYGCLWKPSLLIFRPPDVEKSYLVGALGTVLKGWYALCCGH